MEAKTTITPDLEKIKETLSKIHKLTEQGIEGEKEAAKLKLQKLLQKYKLTIEEIIENDEKERIVDFNKGADGKKILAQVIWSVKSDVKIFTIKNHCSVLVMLTYCEYIEVIEKYKYYWKHYNEEKDAFLKAYLYRHRLHSDFKSSENKPLTEKEEREAWKIRKLMFSMEKSSYVNSTKLLQHENV